MEVPPGECPSALKPLRSKVTRTSASALPGEHAGADTAPLRQVADGEWDVMGAIGDPRFRGQGGGGKGRLDRGPLGAGGLLPINLALCRDLLHHPRPCTARAPPLV